MPIHKHGTLTPIVDAALPVPEPVHTSQVVTKGPVNRVVIGTGSDETCRSHQPGKRRPVNAGIVGELRVVGDSPGDVD